MLRAGFIGFGRMGITHYSILNTHPDVEIAAVCDQSRMMLNILKKYLHVAIYSDYRQMLDNESLDFVVISTPTGSHLEIVNVAIQNDLHVFCEKPFTLDLEQGKEVLADLEHKPVVNQVGYVNRFNEVFIRVKSILEKNIIGEVRYFISEMHGASVLKDSRSGWRSKRKKGGGCLFEFGSHCIDLVVYLLGPPDRISGSMLNSVYSREVEDLVSSGFSYNNGIRGSVFINWSDETFRKPTNIITIIGTKGKLIADKHSVKIYLKESLPGYKLNKGWNTLYITDFAKSVRMYVRGNEFTQQLDHFIECIRNKDIPNRVSFDEGFKTDRVINEILLDAAENGQDVGAKGGLTPFVSSEKTFEYM